MIQVLINRGGENHDYLTSKRELLKTYKGKPIGEICQTPEILINGSAIYNTKKIGCEALRKLPESELLAIIRKAGDNFLNENYLGMDYKEHCRNVVLLTGLPITSVENAGHILYQGLHNMAEVLLAQTPNNNLGQYDLNLGNTGSFKYIPRGTNMGVVAPSNHPAVNSLWLMALAVKYPLLIRPSNEEPLTIRRLVDSLYNAGLPEHSIYFLPGDRQISNAILQESDLGMIFGSRGTISQYDGNSKIKTYGPGNSKIYIDEEYLEYGGAIRLAVDSIMRDGGRGCINTHQIVTAKNGRQFAEVLAQELRKIEAIDPLETGAQIAATKIQTAEAINAIVDDGLSYGGIDLTTSESRPRLKIENDTCYLMPTVIYLDRGPGHPLFTELPFQYVTVTDYSEGIFNGTLALTMLTDDETKIRDGLTMAEKVYVGDISTMDIDLKEPHEGYLPDFLYDKKAYRNIRGSRKFFV
jgi:hypothetical protein